MKRLLAAALLVCALLPVGGCWDKSELPEKGYIMGVALDESESGNYRMTTQVYKPSQITSAKGGKGGKQGTSYLNVSTEDDGMFEAVRDISIHLGRKAQWSHMRLIMIGEKLARKQNIGDMLDFFYRDHEPRLTAFLMIGQGNAADYLQTPPLIENTTSQQMAQIDRSTVKNAAKTVKGSLLRYALQSKSEVGIALLPYFYKNEKGDVLAAGAAIVSQGKVVDILPANLVEPLLMLRNEYTGGVIEVPCKDGAVKGGRKRMETVEVTKLTTKISYTIGADALAARIRTHIDGVIGELSCTKIETVEEEKAFIARVEAEVTMGMKAAIDKLQSGKWDAVGLGNMLYRRDLALWKRWKPEWGERFAKSSFDVKAEVELLNSGTRIAKPNVVK